jgi:hypothetical protein
MKTLIGLGVVLAFSVSLAAAAAERPEKPKPGEELAVTEKARDIFSFQVAAPDVGGDPAGLVTRAGALVKEGRGSLERLDYAGAIERAQAARKLAELIADPERRAALIQEIDQLRISAESLRNQPGPEAEKEARGSLAAARESLARLDFAGSLAQANGSRAWAERIKDEESRARAIGEIDLVRATAEWLQDRRRAQEAFDRLGLAGRMKGVGWSSAGGVALIDEAACREGDAIDLDGGSAVRVASIRRNGTVAFVFRGYVFETAAAEAGEALK